MEEYNSGEGWKVVFPNRDMAEKVSDILSILNTHQADLAGS